MSRSVLVALVFLANAALGTYHAGAEWHFWPGPQECSGVQQLNTTAGNMLDALQARDDELRSSVPRVLFCGPVGGFWVLVEAMLGSGGAIPGDPGFLQMLRDEASALDFAIQRELDSIHYYREMRELLPADQRKAVERIITEEKGHFKRLSEMKKRLGC